MRKKSKKKTLYDHKKESLKVVKVQIEEKIVPLKKWTVGLQMEIENHFGESEEQKKDWLKKLTNLDSVVLCKTLFLCMESGHYDTWEELSDDMPADLITKVNISNAIAINMTRNMPEVAKEMDENAKKLIAEYRAAMKKAMMEAATR